MSQSSPPRQADELRHIRAPQVHVVDLVVAQVGRMDERHLHEDVGLVAAHVELDLHALRRRDQSTEGGKAVRVWSQQ